MMQTDLFSMQNLDIGSLKGFEPEKAFGSSKSEQRLPEKSKSFLSTLNKLTGNRERYRSNRRASETPKEQPHKTDPNSYRTERPGNDPNNQKSVKRQTTSPDDDHDGCDRDAEAISERRTLRDFLMSLGLEKMEAGRDAGWGPVGASGQGTEQLGIFGANDLENLIRRLQLSQENSASGQGTEQLGIFGANDLEKATGLSSGLQGLTQFIAAIQSHVDGSGHPAEQDFSGRVEQLIADVQAFNADSENSVLKSSILEKLQQILQQVNPAVLNNLTAGTDSSSDITAIQTAGLTDGSQGLSPDAIDLEKLTSGLAYINQGAAENATNSAPVDRQSTESNSKATAFSSVEPANDGQGQKQSDLNSLNQGGNPKFSNHESPANHQNKHGLQMDGTPASSGPVQVADNDGYNLAIEEANSKMGPKADVMFSNELDAKMVPTDAGSKDNLIVANQGQGGDKTLEAVSSAREAENSRSAGRSQTLDQIVQKAVVYMKNGQHEVKIDLKPDYLGHVRLQITTENQLVTLKVLTELPLVKEMIESNLPQLKADLQQQGLVIDKLDVSVAHDGNQFEGSGNKAADNKARLFSEKDLLSENELADEEVQPKQPLQNLEPDTGINYFV